MATKVGEAYLEITARNAKLKTKMQESEKAGRSFTQRMGASLVKFGKVAFVGAIAGFTALTAVMIKAGKAAAAEELQTMRLTHQMGRLGVATQRNVNRVESLATELQKFTRFGDTQTREVLSTLMTLSNDFEGSLKNLELAFDIAESGMFDVRTAARYIGLAMTGNVEILGRYVAELKSSTNEQLKFMSSSDKAAFAITLLNQKFGGLARQIGETAAGAWTKLGNAVSDAWEALGAGMLDELTVGFGSVTAAIKEMEPALKDLGGMFAKTIKAGSHAFGVFKEIVEAIQYTLAPERFRANEAMRIAEAQAELAARALQEEKDSIEALLDARRRDLTEREKESKERLDMIVKEADAEIDAAKRVADTKKIWADILKRRREQALTDQVAIWKEEAQQQNKIEEERASSEAEFMQRRMEDIERITKVRAPREARRQEPAFVGAEQLWRRAMVAGGAEPTIRSVLGEEKKHTIQFSNMLSELQDITTNIGALESGLVE